MMIFIKRTTFVSRDTYPNTDTADKYCYIDMNKLLHPPTALSLQGVDVKNGYDGESNGAVVPTAGCNAPDWGPEKTKTGT